MYTYNNNNNRKTEIIRAREGKCKRALLLRKKNFFWMLHIKKKCLWHQSEIIFAWKVIKRSAFKLKLMMNIERILNGNICVVNNQSDGLLNEWFIWGKLKAHFDRYHFNWTIIKRIKIRSCTWWQRENFINK